MALTVSHAGQPGDLGISIFSTNGANQVIASSEGIILPVSGASVSYWDVSTGRLLLHEVKSATGNTASATATLYYQTQNGLNSYNLSMPITVESDQEKTLNLTQLIRTGGTDSDGLMPPAGATSGLVILSGTGVTRAPAAGDLLSTCSTNCNDLTPATLSSPAVRFVSNAVKASCAPTAPVITSISPAKIYLGSKSVKLTITGTNFGASPFVSLPSGVTQASLSPSDTVIVITVNVAYPKPTASADISVTAGTLTSNRYPIMLNGPSFAVVQIDSVVNLMPSGQAAREVMYLLNNLDKTAAANIPLAEAFSTTCWNCTQAKPTTLTTPCDGKTTTEADGTFTDFWSWYEGYTPAGCGQKVTDHWQWCSPSGPTPGLTFMTLIGYIHTNGTEINGNAQPPSEGMPKGTVIGP
jgi:hypothetical protein